MPNMVRHSPEGELGEHTGYRLQRGRGCFATGAEFQRALGELSDAAFKLCVRSCLPIMPADGGLTERKLRARR